MKDSSDAGFADGAGRNLPPAVADPPIVAIVQRMKADNALSNQRGSPFHK
jgi:hypothetical protein